MWSWLKNKFGKKPAQGLISRHPAEEFDNKVKAWGIPPDLPTPPKVSKPVGPANQSMRTGQPLPTRMPPPIPTRTVKPGFYKYPEPKREVVAARSSDDSDLATAILISSLLTSSHHDEPAAPSFSGGGGSSGGGGASGSWGSSSDSDSSSSYSSSDSSSSSDSGSSCSGD